MLELQRALAAARVRDEVGDTLLVVEHEPVFTLGRRRSSAGNVLDPGDTPVVAGERGGDVTWHGPGQLVAYPIFKLRPGERDVHAVLRRLETAVIGVLAELGLSGERRAGATGVWCQGKKVASLG
ncbi:MAG: lipoyl(octanoyl) transferase LipB, partial [Candidatus Hydrogenedentes bacterium]|nr:lipoyl(octanoyl) transferase LipB [Candidatus Hydrogenedentota bacterium]